MRAKQDPSGGTTLWISARDTYDWANRAGGGWPCSTLAGRRLVAAFDVSGDLVDLTVDGSPPDNIDAHELDALTSDMLRDRFGDAHPAIRLEPSR